MERYIGLDAHSQTCTFAVMGPSGKRLREQVLETNGKVIVEFIKSIAGTKQVCLEEGTHSEWLYELLKPLVDEIIVVQPWRSVGRRATPSTLGHWRSRSGTARSTAPYSSRPASTATCRQLCERTKRWLAISYERRTG